MSPTGGVLVQRRTNGSSHNGRLCVPRLGSGSRLAHGSVLHGSHTRIHDLYVSWTQGHLQRGKNQLLGHVGQTPQALLTCFARFQGENADC